MPIQPLQMEWLEKANSAALGNTYILDYDSKEAEDLARIPVLDRSAMVKNNDWSGTTLA